MKKNRLKGSLYQVLVLAAVTVFFPHPAPGQMAGGGATGRTRVSGTVNDPDGKPIPGVKIFLKNQETVSKNTQIKTKKNGKFVHPLVPFGPYKFSIEKEGYRIMFLQVKNTDSTGADEGSFGPYRFGLAASGLDRVVRLRSKGACTLTVVMAPNADYDRLALKAAQETETTPGEAGDKVVRKRHPAEVGKELFDLKNYNGAMEKFQEALELKGGAEDPNLHFAVARCQYELGLYDQASASLQRVTELEKQPRPGLFYYRALIADKQGRSEEAIAFLEQERDNAATPNGGVLAILGSLYRDTGQEDKAIATLAQAVEADPENVNALLTLGTLYGEKGQDDKAEIYFQRAVDAGASAGQDGAAVFFNLGALNYNKGQLRRAADAYERAVKLRPSYAAAHRELGYTYKELGENDKALDHFQAYLKLSPKATDRAEIEAWMTFKGRS
ncbi:MAG: tetratricopeptide repeat protein [Acidobacteriota bacterium]